MKKAILKFTFFIISVLFIFLLSCRDQTREADMAHQNISLPENPFFGKTDASAYTPEVRENMKQLYEDKFGMFVHWGPYAVLEGIWEGKEVAAEWIMRRAFIPVEVYEREAAAKFKPLKFNAADWVDIAERAGMRFIVITAKHHDGFAMYKSAHPYNLVDFAGFGRDILKELSEECAGRGMNLGFYYSQSQDWHEKGAAGNHWDFGSIKKPLEEFDTVSYTHLRAHET